MITTFDAIADDVCRHINTPLTSHSLPALKEDKKQNFFSQFVHLERAKHAYFHFDGKTYPHMLAELNRRAGFFFNMTMHALMAIDGVVNTSSPHFDKATGMLYEKIPMTKDIREGLAALYRTTLAPIIERTGMENIMSASAAQSKSVVTENGWGALAREHRLLLSGGILSAVIRNVGDGDPRGNLRVFLSETWRVATSLSVTEIAGFVLDALRYNPKDVHRLHGEPLKADKPAAASYAVAVASNILAEGAIDSSVYRKANRGLAIIRRDQPGNVYARFAAGALAYAAYRVYGDEGKREDALFRFLDVVGNIEESRSAQVKHLSKEKLDFLHHELDLSAAYYVAKLKRAKGIKEGYVEAMTNAYADYKSRHILVKEKVAGIEWGEEGEESLVYNSRHVVRNERILRAPEGSMLENMMASPFDIANRRHAIESFYAAGNTTAAQRWSAELYRDVDALRGAITPDDLGEAFLLSEFWLRKGVQESKMPLHMAEWFAQHRKDDYYRAREKQGAYLEDTAIKSLRDS